MATFLSLAPLLISGAGWFLTLGAAFAGSWWILAGAGVVTFGGQALAGWWHARRAGVFPSYSPVLAALPFWGWAPAFLGDIVNPAPTSRGWQGLLLYLAAGLAAGVAFWLGHWAARPRPPRLGRPDSPKAR